MKRLIIILLCQMAISHIAALDIIFRYDDFLLHEDVLQDSLVEIYAEEDVPLHIGVIPFAKDTTPIFRDGKSVERIRELHKDGILVVGTHGFNHTKNHEKGEFCGLTKEEQRFRLENGKHLLDSVFGIQSYMFIPPWNQYDSITLKILSDLGYTILSAALSNDNFFAPDMQYYPQTVDHPKKLISIINRNARREGLVVCVFHRYDFSQAFSLNDLRNILRLIQKTPQVNIVSMNQLYQYNKSFDAKRMRANLKQPLLTKLLGTRVMILPVKDICRLRVYDVLLHILLVLVLMGLGLLKITPNYLYWSLYTILVVFTIIQTWYQIFMPKIGLLLIILAAITILAIFWLSENKARILRRNRK